MRQPVFPGSVREVAAKGRSRSASASGGGPVLLRQLLANAVACRGQAADDENAKHPDQYLAEHAAPPVWRPWAKNAPPTGAAHLSEVMRDQASPVAPSDARLKRYRESTTGRAGPCSAGALPGKHNR